MSENKKSLAQELEEAKAEIARLKEARSPGLSVKITEKGGLSVYGLGRFPVTLYGGQWLKLNGYLPTIVAFIEANKSKMSWKE